MRALLLGAGLGTRLRPLTDVLPKCLAPIRGRPLLEYWLDLLFAADLEQVVINTHHHAEMVKTYVGRTAWSDRIELAYEPELLGTGGTILRHQAKLSSGAFIVAHADNLSAFDCHAFLRRHAQRPRGCLITMMTFRTLSPESCGIVSLDESGVVREFHEKVKEPPGDLANAAVYVLEPDIFDFLRGLEKSRIDFSTEVIPSFMGRIFTFHNGAYHEDIGTLEHWRRAQTEYPGELPAARQSGAWNLLLKEHPEIESMVSTLLSGSETAS